MRGFLDEAQARFADAAWSKMTLSQCRDKNSDLRNVFLKPVRLQSGLRVQFLFRYQTRDVTKNWEPELALQELERLLSTDFLRADLFGQVRESHLILDAQGRAKVKHKRVLAPKEIDLKHDRTKVRNVPTEENVYLRELGVVDAQGKVRTAMGDKYRQIDKFVEIMAATLAEAPEGIRIADMGSGKGYLTFALYDYLARMGRKPQVVGVEFREVLVELSNGLARQCGFAGLSFVAGTIQQCDLGPLDALIALHACDTATDDAIVQGIVSGAKWIVCAPCCHKQVRKDLDVHGPQQALFKHGILLERQAEILTDGIRALLLESLGYKTKVFEFIGTEHTPKNVLIVAEKTGSPRVEALAEIEQLKKDFGLKRHALQEKLTQI